MAYKVKKKIPELTLPTGNASSSAADPGMSPSEMYVYALWVVQSSN